MNVSNELKNKVLRKDCLRKEEVLEFVSYLVHKTLVITSTIYHHENYLPMYLFLEICYSYDLIDHASVLLEDSYFILEIGKFKFLVDFEFSDNKMEELSKNKYIEYREDTFLTYQRIRKGEFYE